MASNSTTVLLRALVARVVLPLALVLGMTGCMGLRASPSSSPVRASASDGAVIDLATTPANALASVDSVLRAQGYNPRRLEQLVLRTEPRNLGADTSIVLTAEIVPYEMYDGARSRVVVVITGTYSVPSRGIRNAMIHDGPQVPPGLWARVGAVGTALVSR